MLANIIATIVIFAVGTVPSALVLLELARQNPALEECKKPLMKTFFGVALGFLAIGLFIGMVLGDLGVHYEIELLPYLGYVTANCVFVIALAIAWRHSDCRYLARAKCPNPTEIAMTTTPTLVAMAVALGLLQNLVLLA